MSKAEQRALEAYPSTSHYWNAEPDRNAEAREFYKQGYIQAEKDNELTWEDISEIFRISEQLKTSWWFRDNEQTKQIGTQVFWEEILKRFNKEGKEK